MIRLPKHIIRRYDCTYCGARMFLGEYPDPATAEARLNEWVSRHLHPEPE